MAINDEFLNELRMKIDIEDIVSPYVNLRRAGRNFTGLCPFHNEKTPSFTVYSETQSFYCFGCGAGGDVITFVRRIENLDYVEAVKTLAQRAGMSMPEDGYDDSLTKTRMRLLAANREAARFFHETLLSPKGKDTLNYLLERGISMKMIKYFGLGYAPNEWDGLLKHLQSKGYSTSELLEANLARKSPKEEVTYYYDNFRNRMMIPIIDLRGNVIAFGGRVLDDSKPKYVNTSDTLVYKKSQAVFALNFAKKGNEGKLILAEGYLDVIALHQAGFINAIACLGTALTREQARIIARYAQEVILAYDSDGAGQEATRKAIRIFNEIGLKVRVLRLSGGKDPDEIIKNHGKERFQSLLDGAANDTEYKLLAERDKYDVSVPDGKLSFLKGAVEILANLENAIEQDIYVSRLSRELDVNKDAIMAQIRGVSRKKRRSKELNKFKEIQHQITAVNDRINPERAQNLRAAKAEEVLIASLFANPDFYTKINEKVTPENFITQFNRRVFSKILSRLQQGRPVELSYLASDFTPEEMGRLTEIQALSLTISNTLEECEDCIRVLVQEQSKRQTPDVSQMSDEEYLNLFKAKNK